MPENIPNQNPTSSLPPSSSPMDDNLITPGQKSTSADLFRLTPSVPPPAPVKPPTTPPAPKKEPIMDVSQIKSSIHSGKKSKKWLIILIIIILLLVTPVVFIYLTESGKIDWGIDRIYAKTPIPQLFGGISADTKTALTKSLAATGQVKAFGFQAHDGRQTSHGTILNNNDYQFIYGNGEVSIEYRRIGDEIYYTANPITMRWAKISSTDPTFKMSDVLSTYFYISPYKILEIALEHVNPSSFRDQITSGKLNVYKINFESQSSKEEDQKILEKLKSNEPIDPLYGVGKVQITLSIDNDSILKKASMQLQNNSKYGISTDFNISKISAIEKPKIDESSALDDAVSNSQKQARDARRRSDLNEISLALQTYLDDNPEKTIPKTTLSQTSDDAPPTLAEAEKAEILSLGVSGNILEEALTPDYISTLPKDPSSEYYYSYISTGHRFRLYAVSESSTDKDCTEKVGSHCFISVSQ